MTDSLTSTKCNKGVVRSNPHTTWAHILAITIKAEDDGSKLKHAYITIKGPCANMKMQAYMPSQSRR